MANNDSNNENKSDNWNININDRYGIMDNINAIVSKHRRGRTRSHIISKRVLRKSRTCSPNNDINYNMRSSSNSQSNNNMNNHSNNSNCY